MKYKAVFFDLDGTLFDTSEGIYNTFDIVFKAFDIFVDRREYPLFIGPPVINSLIKTVGREKAHEALEVFRDHYGTVGKFQAGLYDGIEDVIKTFFDNGIRVYTATSKNWKMSVEILQKYGIYKYFTKVYGADASACRVEKSDVVKYAIGDSKENPKESLLIGDTYYDIEGSAAVGMDCLVVLYGFGARETLEGKNVVGYARRPTDIFGAAESVKIYE